MNNKDQIATINDIQICYRDTENQNGIPLLLIMGLGAQLIGWPEQFIIKLQKSGFRVVWFDNRDCGLSTKTEGDPPDGADFLVRATIWKRDNLCLLPFRHGPRCLRASRLLRNSIRTYRRSLYGRHDRSDSSYRTSR